MKHTFKLHICPRWKLVTFKRLLEFLLQCGRSNFPILLFVFFPIIHLRNEVIEFREDRHNRDCLSSVTMRRLEILNNLTVPCTLLIEEPLFNPNNGRDTSGAKQNLNASSVVQHEGKVKHTILHGFGPVLLSPSPSPV